MLVKDHQEGALVLPPKAPGAPLDLSLDTDSVQSLRGGA
jgi:hypothetical protein